MVGSTLTRIKNNQITDATIWANAKIIPGSIVGSLFNSNITVTSDFTITGNLTVQGSSTYLTVASTNTYVNDPLIVLNNAFSGSNSYDLGFVFNRGSSPNKAFYWDESSGEFRLITTTETGTTYGSIAAETNFESLRLGNIYLNNYTSTRALFVGASGLVTTDAEYTYDSTNDTVTIGKIIIAGNSAVTIKTTGTNQDLKLAPNGTGVVDFDASNATNLADPVSGQDAVTLSYLNTQLSSAVTNLIDDDTSIYILDTGGGPGRIEVTVDGDLVANITQDITTLTNDVTVSNTTVSTTTTSGALVVTGGVGVGGNITVGRRFKSTDDTQSTSTTTGAIITAGGVGIAKNLTVGGDTTITGNLTVQGVLTSVNSTTLDVSDLQITLAKGAGSSAAADGAGINVDYGNVNANITYTHATTSWNFNKPIIGTSYANFGGNVLATGGVFNALTVNGNESVTGYLNVTGNVLAAAGTFSEANIAAMYFSPYGSIYNDQAANPQVFQLSTNSLANGGGIFTVGGFNTGVYSTGGIVFQTGATARYRNYPTGGVSLVTINSTGQIFANNTTDTSSLTTGALIVAGGTAVGKTLWVGEGAVINSTQSAEQFQFNGQGNAGLIYANAAKNAIVFSNAGNATVQDGVVVKFDSVGAIRLPVGSSAQRPGTAGNVDVAGLLRYSTTSNNVEFYDGSQWTAAGSQFTTITTNSFNGDGSTTGFTLSTASTTAGTIVMVNGVVQIPVTAYSVSGTTLTFTEAPATGDVVDARVLITTATVSSVASGNGYNTFDVSVTPYANITAGTGSPTVRVSVDGVNGKVTFTNDVTINGQLTVLGDSSGNINIGNETGDRLQLRGKTVYDQTALNAVTDLLLLDSFSTSAFTTARYTVQVKNGGSVSAAEIILSQDTATSNIATYAIISTLPGTFQSNISSGTVRLFYTPTASQNANIKVLTTYIV